MYRVASLSSKTAQLLTSPFLLPVGSGEILNDTLEVHTVDGDPSTDDGSGDGALLNVTDGQVSGW